jgi:hypothetical protein
MNAWRVGLVLAAVALWATPSFAQSRLSRCLHAENESEMQAQRRIEALDASDLIIKILDRQPRSQRYPTWEALAKSPRVATLRGMAGKAGDLVRKIAWGADEPLPGWRIHYVAAQDGYAFSLTDIRDSCQFTLASNDTGLVIEGRPADRRGQVRVIPLDSTH